jgi:hypothetical protein
MMSLLIRGWVIKDPLNGATNTEVIFSFLLTILIIYMISSTLFSFIKKEEGIE